MLVNQIGSTTTIYAKSNLTGVSSTTPTSSLVTSSTTASTTATTRTTASTTVSVARSSSATAKATSSATLVYGASSTAKTVVSSTTAKSVSSTTTRAVSSNTTVNRASGSTTPSVTSSSTPGILINHNITRIKTSNDAISIALRNEKSNSLISNNTEVVEDYAYLSHLGDAGQTEVEDALVDLGFDDVSDGEFINALESFKKSVGLDDYSTYSSEVIDKLDEVHLKLMAGTDAAKKLEELGFYNSKGGSVEPTSVKGDAAPNDLATAINNFCLLYNIEDRDKIGEKLDEVYNCYNNVLNNEAIESISEDLYDLTYEQKMNFSKSWTFLKYGMGFSNELSSAILGNWYWEGAFSETNRQNLGQGYILDDSDVYVFDEKDGIGFGIMQWTDSERKGRFAEIAEAFKSGVGNINVQLMLFKDEISGGGMRYDKWQDVIKCTDLESYTKQFLFKMEEPLDQGEKIQAKRIDTAKKICVAMELYEE